MIQYILIPESGSVTFPELRHPPRSHRAQGENLGKGGIDIAPSEERAAPQAPAHLQFDQYTNPESLEHHINGAKRESGEAVVGEESLSQRKLLPRETGHDIGMCSPVPLSAEAVSIITRLRNMKDEAEDWGRWRDVVFRAKAALAPRNIEIPPSPHNTRRKRKAPASASTSENAITSVESGSNPTLTGEDVRADQLTAEDVAKIVTSTASVSRLAAEDAVLASTSPGTTAIPKPETLDPPLEEDGMHYCPECFVPLHPDPKPESLYIFLHAMRYTTSLGEFETQMPEWAAEGWEWDRSA